MLILTRRLEESIVIGDSITVKILGVEGDRVKLGIEAPRDVGILRQELVEQVREQNLAAARTARVSSGASLESLLQAFNAARQTRKSEPPS